MLIDGIDQSHHVLLHQNTMQLRNLSRICFWRFFLFMKTRENCVVDDDRERASGADVQLQNCMKRFPTLRHIWNVYLLHCYFKRLKHFELSPVIEFCFFVFLYGHDVYSFFELQTKLKISLMGERLGNVER
jgi:hypothetical protein